MTKWKMAVRQNPLNHQRIMCESRHGSPTCRGEGVPLHWKRESTVLREGWTPHVLSAESSARRVKGSEAHPPLSLIGNFSITAWAREGKWTCRLVWKQQNAVFPELLIKNTPSSVQSSETFLPDSQLSAGEGTALHTGPPGNKTRGSPPYTDTASKVSVTLTAWSDWGLRGSGGQRVVKVCFHVNVYISQSRLLRSNRFCTEKERRPRKLSSLHGHHAAS